MFCYNVIFIILDILTETVQFNFNFFVSNMIIFSFFSQEFLVVFFLFWKAVKHLSVYFGTYIFIQQLFLFIWYSSLIG